MNKKGAMIFAVVIALVAVVLFQLYISGEKAKYTDESNLEKVIVAKMKIKAGTTIKRSMLTTKKLYKEYVPKDAVRAADSRSIIDHTPKVDIPKGDAIQAAHFSEGGTLTISSRFLAPNIQKGERGFTIKVDSESGVSGLIRPGDYVDIMGTFKKPGSIPMKVTMTILQNIPVLAIGSQVGTTGASSKSRRGSTYRTITISASPEEAELLEYCRRTTKLIFVLRNPEDREVIDSIPQVDFNNIFKKDVLKNYQKKRNQLNKKRIEILK